MIEKLASIYRIECGLSLPGNLETISIPGLAGKQIPAAMHAVQTEEGLVLIDPFNLSCETTRQLEAIGTPGHVLITNLNHDRDAMDYRRRYGAKIWGHRDLSNYFKFKFDFVFDDGDTVPGDLEAILLPGTFRGETVFLDSREGGSLIAGDAIFNVNLDEFGLAGNAMGAIGWPDGLSTMPRFLMRDEKRAIKSYEQLLERDFTRIFMTHGKPVLDDAKAPLRTALKEYRSVIPFFMRRAAARISSNIWEVMP
jgi:glyoxylase-like metal-dependent hydrolase (beta-lactamase superfamily II)